MNKIKTCKAARRLEIHPAQFLFHAAELDMSLSFEDVWPDIDEAWIQTISASGRYNQIQNVGDAISFPEPLLTVCTSGLSKAAVLVVEKLYRKGKWGNFSTSFVGLGRITHLSPRDLQDAIAELRKKSFLYHDGTGLDKISLDSARRNEIETITQQRT